MLVKKKDGSLFGIIRNLKRFSYVVGDVYKNLSDGRITYQIGIVGFFINP
jgi:hypothetical protein